MHCLLCKSENTTAVRTLLATNLIADWRAAYHLDITSELEGQDQLQLYRCDSCGLQFFHPALAGSDQLYEKLEEFDWYYLPRKWEYDAALEDLRAGERLLEIGSGRGDFVALAESLKQVEATGLELNTRAISFAQRAGRPVYRRSLQELSEEQSESFDAVCGFQVLEHIPDPECFIADCLNMLKPGGRLLLSVPDSEGFLRHVENHLLDQPPHHVSLWSSRVFEYLPSRFPLKIESIRFEPLMDYHLDWYGDIQLNRLPRLRLLSGLAYRLTHKLVLPLLRRTGLHHYLRGHTIYVCCTKLEGLS
ncbi:MAG TPA: methyltransferase domain-containing protein [Pyrinomonadaceae bacterium]|jgi:SAM-dependent methyltransferase